MREVLLAWAAAHGGVITRASAVRIAPAHVIDDAVRAGALTVIFPGTYALPELAADLSCRRSASVAYTGGALSHLDALDVWGLLPGPVTSQSRPIHVAVDAARGPVRARGLVVHRRRGLGGPSLPVQTRSGLSVVAVEQAIVDSWHLLAAAERRSPIITAMRDRRTTAARLIGCLDAIPRVAGVRAMRELTALVAAGCHSELEIWGHAGVFDDPRLPAASLQFPVRLPSGLVYLDRWYHRERVDAELDGAAFHGSPGQRERDLRRDAELAALGILVVRFTHRRLHRAPEAARDDLRRVLDMRRRQLGNVAA
jgi:very-short-patch-repair endonuclease